MRGSRREKINRVADYLYPVLACSILLIAIVFFFSLSGCKKTEKKELTATPTVSVDRGKGVYLSACIACHNADPKKDGGLGPAIHGASLELLEAKTLKGEYPKGYKPKRETRLMVPLPHVKDDLPSIHAFLNQ